MPMTAILIVFLMLGGWALLSASQQWNARRDAHAVAAAAARAGAQGDELTLRSSRVVDPVGADRASRGHIGRLRNDGARLRRRRIGDRDGHGDSGLCVPLTRLSRRDQCDCHSGSGDRGRRGSAVSNIRRPS